jgi:glycosyltransferase involved in cell wall biosynthesis
MNNPLVSIIINCYNGEKYLNKAIDSVIGQKYNNWEIIFWDNCSTDSSSKIVLSFNDKRIYYNKSGAHTTLGSARASAIKKANGEYITFLDCDDIWIKDKLDIQVKLITSGNYCFTYAGHIVISESGKIIGSYIPRQESEISFENLVENFNIDMVTPMIKTLALSENSITFNSDIHGSEEVNLFLRLSLRCKGIALNKSLGFSRRVNNSLTHRVKDKWHLDMQVTIDQLKMENPRIEETHLEQIKYLKFKKCYFQTKWLMIMGDYEDAKKILDKCDVNLKTMTVLRYLVRYPFLWRFFHFIKERAYFLRNSNAYRKLISK